jgi:hypothetical protein
LLAEVEEKIRDLFEDEDHPIAEEMADVEDIRVFTVSAKNYMQLIGEDNTSSSVPLYNNILTTKNTVPIPKTRGFLLNYC